MSEKFVSPCKPPEGLERELLEILVEECSEVIQRVQKAQRFGIDEVQPGQRLNNAERISLELGDIMGTLEELYDLGTLRPRDVSVATDAKRQRLKHWLQSTTKNQE